MNEEDYDNPYQDVIEYEHLLLMQEEAYPTQEEEEDDELQ